MSGREYDWAKITRLEVIDQHGRDYTRLNLRIQPSLQDDGRTLKLFIEPITGQGEGESDECDCDQHNFGTNLRRAWRGLAGKV